jgi:aminoglycoside phosphotransferase (APT) family kinase protein
VSAPRHPNHRLPGTLPVELRRTTVPPAVRAWIARSTGQSVARAERLAGASSTAVHRLRFPDGLSLVLRRYVWPGFLEDEPIAPQRELDALSFAGVDHLPVPGVVAADITGGDIGDGIPAILMSFLPGRALASPDPVRLAEAATAIHAIDPSGFAHEYFPWFEDIPLRPPSSAHRPRVWERALEIRINGMPSYRPTFIHRDFHPGNVLWRRGRCSGIVDWANACRGPAGCDVATCYGNLIDWAGYDVADKFVAAYEALTGQAQHPYWEIASVLEHGPSPWTHQDIAESERRLDRALAALGGT